MSESQKILAVDIGNSYTKVGRFEAGELQAVLALPTQRDDAAAYREALQAQGLVDALKDATGVVVSSVVPEAREVLAEFLAEAREVRVLWLEREQLERLQFGAVNLSAYAPGELGADRAVNALAGHLLHPERRVCVCDFGTTTTVDLVDHDGRFLGGAICPGPLKFQSLVDQSHAAQLYQVDVFQRPQGTPGRTTQASLANGLFYGYHGVIVNVVETLLDEAGWPMTQTTLVFTGGFARQAAEMVEDYFPAIEVDPELTLKGLFHLWGLNQPLAVAAS